MEWMKRDWSREGSYRGRRWGGFGRVWRSLCLGGWPGWRWWCQPASRRGRSGKCKWEANWRRGWSTVSIWCLCAVASSPLRSACMDRPGKTFPSFLHWISSRTLDSLWSSLSDRPRRFSFLHLTLFYPTPHDRRVTLFFFIFLFIHKFTYSFWILITSLSTLALRVLALYLYLHKYI